MMMSGFPPFHPDWLVTFWFATPVLRALDPHVVLGVLVAVGGGWFFLKRKNAPAATVSASNLEEEQFHYLLKRKKIIEEKISELKSQSISGEIQKDQYETKLGEYEKHLEKVSKELLYYT